MSSITSSSTALLSQRASARVSSQRSVARVGPVKVSSKSSTFLYRDVRQVGLTARKSAQSSISRQSLVCVGSAGPAKPTVNALATEQPEGESADAPKIFGIDAKTLRITASVFGWFFLNAVFAIYNKKTLNCFPYPWILSEIQIGVGALMMIAAWQLKIVEKPKLTMETYKALVPTATLHLIAHVSACASYNFSSVSFMQVVKAAEPVCSVIVLTAFYGARYSPLVWATLIPIVCGVAVSASAEINFSMAAFAMAMISNLACAFRGITSKGAQRDLGLQGINLYAAIAIVSTVLLLPPTLLVEGRFLVQAFTDAGPAMVKLGYGATAAAFLPFLLTGSVFYHLYNQTAYQALADMSPLSHSVANTVKRVVIMTAGLYIFKNPITPLGACAAAVAIGGTFLYSLACQHDKRQKDAAAAVEAK